MDSEKQPSQIEGVQIEGLVRNALYLSLASHAYIIQLHSSCVDFKHFHSSL